MDPERWRRITETFDSAMECAPDKRDRYLDQACAGDDSLRDEVRRLLTEFEKAGDFLEKPLGTPGQAVSEGDVIAGRYRIEAFIGRGGMGEVYRAHDEFMDERVALKTVRLELSRNPSLMRRFQREVQLARRVTHPNVCRVFETGVHDLADRPIYFFIMQLLEGETLASRMQRSGCLKREEALAFIEQMAGGLDAAHQAGVIHRDFKSANVILCDGKAVITDFGLARFETTESTPEAAGNTSTHAQIAGTIAYMSPEQLSGGKITAASDIYSLGVVIFEMATGRLPFDGHHIVQSAMQRAAPDIRAMAPGLEPQWAATIGRCLQHDPAKRFPSAADAAHALRSRNRRPPMAYWTRRQWTKAAAACGASAAGVALIPALSRYSSQSSKLPEGAQALLSPITNSTGDPRFEGITELFRNQLSQSVHLNLIEESQLGAVLKQMGKAEDTTDPAAVREAAWRSNGALWVTGTVSRIAADYVLNVQVEVHGSAPDNPRSKSLRSFSAPDAGRLMRSVRDASVWIREAVGESASKIASFDRLPADVTTPSWEALAYYARGQQFFMKQDFDPAILEFEAALREDPKFTLAALRRADLLVSQGRQSEGFPQWRAAIQMLSERPVTRAEELNARGMFAQDSGDIEAADRYFRTWAQEYPFDWRAPFYRMLPLVLNGYASQALELLKHLRDSMPEYGDIYAQMIACCLVLGQTSEAESLVPELRKRGRPERADLREGYIRFRKGDSAGYLAILRSVQSSPSYRRGAADAMLREALLLIDAGYPEAAADNVERFLKTGKWIETEPQQIGLRMAQAWAEMLAGRRAAALEHAQTALESETGPVLVAIAGSLFARTNANSLANRALELCTPLLDLPLYQIARHRILGEQAKAAGHEDQAIDEFRRAAALEPRIAHRQYLMEALPASSPERLQLCLNAVRIPWQLLRPPPLHCLGSLSVAVPAVNGVRGLNEPFAKQFAASTKNLGKAI